jgi:hypothetical protein
MSPEDGDPRLLCVSLPLSPDVDEEKAQHSRHHENETSQLRGYQDSVDYNHLYSE